MYSIWYIPDIRYRVHGRNILDMARKSKRVVLSSTTPSELRVLMSQGHKLSGNPSRQQLHKACVIGSRVGHSARGKRVKCASRIGPGARWTTAEAWDEYEAIINGEA